MDEDSEEVKQPKKEEKAKKYPKLDDFFKDASDSILQSNDEGV